MAERPTSTMAVYTARPTVQVDAQQYPEVSELLLAMEMTEGEGGLSALEVRLTNLASEAQGGAALAFEDEAIFKLGSQIAVYAGDETAPREIFRGTITGLEAEFPDGSAPSLVVLAEDAFQQARMARRTKLHEHARLADLARNLANQLGLTPVITGFSDDIGPQVQFNESDLAFLRRLLARYDGDLQVVGTELHLAPRSGVQRGRMELELHGQLRRARVLADLAHQVTDITVSGWDVQQGQKATATGTGAALGPGSGRKGADILRQGIGPRSHHIAHLGVTTAAEARALADAAYDARARRFLVVEGTAEGNANLRVGTHLVLSGMGPRFDNTYYVVLARHRFDLERGYETDFTAECAFLGTP